MQILLVVNSAASSVTARTQVVIRKALSADHDVSMVETSRPGHATRLARGAATKGVDVVVALGGDGTLNEAANGVAGSDTALAVLPGGSTNVFARTIGLPDDPVEATGALLDALTRNSIRRVGLGSVNGRYFLFNVGMGLDAEVVGRVDRQASLKRFASHAWFVWCAVDTYLRHYDHSRPRFAVHHSDGSVIDDAYFALCLNTNPYTFMGSRPLNIAPDAHLDSGLAMATIRSLSLPAVLSILSRALMSTQGLRRNRHVDYRPDISSLTVTGHGPFPYQVDGEYMGETTELRVIHEPEVLGLVVP